MTKDKHKYQKQVQAQEESSVISEGGFDCRKESPAAGKKRAFSINTLQRIARYLLVGTFTALLSLGTFELALAVFESFEVSLSGNWRVFSAEIFSVIAACLFSFVVNSKFTFKDRKARRAGIFLYILFYAVITPIGILFILWLNTFIEWLWVCKLIKMSINLVLDYTYYRFFIFAYLKKRFDV